jgi:teichuronic acid biosynthesis glycosyltransferase TuaC
MLPDAYHPERGQFVRDQVAQLARLAEVDVRLHELAPGPRALARGALVLRGRYGSERWDVVHAHFGLTAWPALAVPARIRALTVHGTDVTHPRTRLLTRAIAPRMDVLAVASAPLAAQLSNESAGVQVLPCGVDLERFRPIPRAQARAELGLDPSRPFVLFAADPARPEKRHDRALALARAASVQLRALGSVAPTQVPVWINAANAVLVPSEREGFGLAVLEALACDVPVLSTPVGVHPEALDGVAGTLCAPFALQAWLRALGPHLNDSDPRIAGRARAEPFSAHRMAERVLAAWRAALRDAG